MKASSLPRLRMMKLIYGLIYARPPLPTLVLYQQVYTADESRHCCISALLSAETDMRKPRSQADRQ